MNLKNAFSYIKDQLSDIDRENIDVDIEIFLESITGFNRFDIYNKNYVLTQTQVSQIDRFIKESKNNIPVAYIIGKRNFYGHDFIVSPDVLIPRFETEILVEKVLSVCDGKKVFDMCTGSGCIGITLLKEGSPESVVCTDISINALQIAKKNADNLLSNSEKKKILFLAADKLNGLKHKVDIFISNPPYIASDVVKKLESQVVDHEPLMALDGGKTGYDFYIYIKEHLKNILEKGGYMFLEIGYDQEMFLKDLYSDIFDKVQIIKDYSGLPRIIFGEGFKL